MRKLILSILFLVVASVASAQEGTLTTPVPRSSATKMKIRSFTAVTSGSNVITTEVSFQDAANVEIAVVAYTVPDPAFPSATFLAMCTAMLTPRSGETGNDARKMAFRVMGYLADRGYLPPHTLVP